MWDAGLKRFSALAMPQLTMLADVLVMKLVIIGRVMGRSKV